MPDEAIFSNRDKFANEGMRLNACSRSDNNIGLDLGERANEAVIGNLAAIEIARLNHLDALTELDVAHAGLVYLRLSVHGSTPSLLRRGSNRSATSCPVSIDS